MRTILSQPEAPQTTLVSRVLDEATTAAHDAKRSSNYWRGASITLLIILAALLTLAATGGLGRTQASQPKIPLCDGCGYTVTTFYPDHTYRVVNYFSEGGQQVAESGEWVK